MEVASGSLSDLDALPPTPPPLGVSSVQGPAPGAPRTAPAQDAPLSQVDSTPDTVNTVNPAELNALPDATPPLQKSYQDTQGVDPDHAAQVLSISKQLNQPASLIDKNLPLAKQLANDPTPAHWAAFQQAYPKAAQYLLDRNNMAVAKDDTQALGQTEQAVQNAKQANTLWDAIKFGAESSATGEMLRGGAPPDVVLPKDAGVFMRGAAGLSGLIPDLPEMFVGGIAGGVAGAASTGPVAAIPYVGQALAGVAAAAGGSAGAFALPAAIKAGFIHHYQNGDVKSAGDLWNMTTDILSAAAKQGAVGLATGLAGPAVGAGAQALGVAGTTAAKTAALAAEVGTMTTAGAAVEGHLPIENDLIDAALLVGTMHYAVGPAASAVYGEYAARKLDTARAETARNLVASVGDAAQRSKLLERLPEGYQEAVKQIAGGSGAETAYIPSQAFDTYFQSKQLDPGAEAERLGISPEYQVAKEIGGDIPVPFDKLAATYGKSEHLIGLQNDVKFDPLGDTVNETNERAAYFQSKIAEEHQAAQSAIDQDANLKEGSDYIYSSIKDDLQAAQPQDLSPKAKAQADAQIDQAAKIWAARSVTEAQRRGQTPQEYFDSIRPQIVSEGAPDVAGQTLNQSSAEPAPTFYSRLQMLLEQKLPEKATSEQVRAIARDANQEEVKASGLEDFLGSKKKVDKRELLNHLEGNRVRLTESTKANTGLSPSEEARYFDLGEKRNEDRLSPAESDEYYRLQEKSHRPATTRYAQYTLPGGENYRELLLTLPKREGGEAYSKDFRSAHWDEPNVIGHVRLTDRTDSEGKRVLMMEEAQSDWHQAGRKEGYKGDVINEDGDKRTLTGVPDAPFKKNWHELLLKRVLREAAEKGYDKLAWTTGEQQSERYPIEEDEAKQAMASGMKGFYDKIIPAYLNKYAKKWGAKVGESELPIGKDLANSQLKYEGPERTPDEVMSAAKNASYSSHEYFSDVAKGIEGGMTTAEAIRNYGNIHVAEAIGGKADWEGPSSAKVHSIDITPAMRESVVHEGQPLFQPGPDDPRGSITFGSDHAVIKLMKGADASTFLHESAHLWLKDQFDYVRANADNISDSQAKDWKTTADWLGVKDDQAELTRDQQEKFASGFETYLREGKAPSEGLKGAFRAFRTWLTKIYRSAGQVGAPISDDVRGVFYRLLATDDEIAHATRELGYEPMKLDPASVPESVRNRLAKLQEQAHEEAVSKLLKPQMDELKLERKQFLDEKRSETSKQVKDELKDHPFYKAQEDLRARLETKDSAKKISENYTAGKLGEEGEGKFEAHAELAGYSSGDEMAKDIQAKDTLDVATNKEVRSRMRQYSDLRNTAAMKDEALRAVHGEKSLELLAMEKEILDSLVKRTAEGEEARKVRQAKAKADAKAIRETARATTENQTVKGASNYLVMFRMERWAAERGAKAISEKDYEGAARAKQSQMLYHALGMESIRVAKQIEKQRSFLWEQQSKRADLFKEQEHFVQVANILDKLGFPRRDYDPATKKESLAEWVTRMNGVTNTVNMPNWLLDESRIKKYQELKVSELTDAINAIKNIVKVANFEKRAYTLDKGAELDAIVTDLRIASGLNGIDKEANQPPMVPDRFDRIKTMANRYFLNLTKMQTLFLKLDGFHDNGKWSRIFFDSTHKAADDESEMMREDKGKIEKFWGAYSKKELSDMVDKKFYSPELGTSTTKMKILMMAFNYGNEDNRIKLSDTNPVGVDKKTPWGPEQLQSLFQQHLTEKDWQAVQSGWDMINERWPQIEALHKELTGFAPKKVEASAFNVATADGKTITLRGGYFPLKEDVRASVRAATRADIDSPLYTEQNPAWVATTKTGHTKERTSASYSVSLDPSIIQNHMRDVVHDLAFRPTIIDLRRLLANQELQGIIRDNVGMDGYASIRDWVQAVAGGGNQGQGSDIMASISRELRSRATTANIFLRPSVLLKHLFNPLLYGGDVVEGFGYKDAFHAYFVRGALDFIPKQLGELGGWQAAQAIRDQVYSKSPFMRDMHDNPDLSLTETTNRLFGKNSPLQNFSKHLIGGILEGSSIPMWLEAYEKKMSSPAVEEEDAIKYADSLIGRVQGSGRRLDAPGIQRGGELGKALSMYYSFMSTEFNRFQIEKGKLQLRGTDQVPQFLGYAGSRLLMAAAPTLIAGTMFGSQSDQDVWKKVVKEILGYPAAMLPGVREVSSVALDEALGLKSFGYQPSPAAAAIQSALDNVHEIKRYATTGDDAQRVVESAAHTASYLFPYPDQINSWLGNAYDSFVNGMTPQASDLYKRRPRKDRQ